MRAWTSRTVLVVGLSAWGVLAACSGDSTSSGDGGSGDGGNGGVLAAHVARCTVTYSDPTADYNGPTQSWTSADSQSSGYYAAGQLDGICTNLNGADNRGHTFNFTLTGEAKVPGAPLKVLGFASAATDPSTGLNPVAWLLPVGSGKGTTVSGVIGDVVKLETAQQLSPYSSGAKGKVTMKVVLEANVP